MFAILERPLYHIKSSLVFYKIGEGIMSMLDNVESCGCVVSAFKLYVYTGRCAKNHSREEAEKMFLGEVVSENPQELDIEEPAWPYKPLFVHSI